MPQMQTLIVDGDPDYRQEIADIVHKHIPAENRNVREFTNSKPVMEMLRNGSAQLGLLVIGTNTAEDIVAVLYALSPDEKEKTVVYTADEEFMKRCRNEGFKVASKKKATAYLEEEISKVLYQ